MSSTGVGHYSKRKAYLFGSRFWRPRILWTEVVMKCSMKTMLKVGCGVLLSLGALYLAFPTFREVLLAVAPFLLFLICPLSMFLMMKGMSSQDHKTTGQTTSARPGDTPKRVVDEPIESN